MARSSAAPNEPLRDLKGLRDDKAPDQQGEQPVPNPPVTRRLPLSDDSGSKPHRKERDLADMESAVARHTPSLPGAREKRGQSMREARQSPTRAYIRPRREAPSPVTGKCRTFSGAGTTGPSSNDDGAITEPRADPTRPSRHSSAAPVLGLANSADHQGLGGVAALRRAILISIRMVTICAVARATHEMKMAPRASSPSCSSPKMSTPPKYETVAGDDRDGQCDSKQGVVREVARLRRQEGQHGKEDAEGNVGLARMR